MSRVTEILSGGNADDPSMADQLLPLVYEELRKLAAARLSQEQSGQTLQATALVHEAYLRLVDVEQPQHWNGRKHFFGAAAEAMRRILVENARKKSGPKAGGRHNRVDLPDVAGEDQASALEMLALSESLDRLEAERPRAAQVVKLRYFAGLTEEEAANVLGISKRTVKNDWDFAKAWLKRNMEDPTGGKS